MQYFVLARNCTPVGPFKSVSEAEDYIRKDAAETFKNGLENGIPNDLPLRKYFDEHQIFQLVKTVRPVPALRTSISLSAVKS